MMTRSVHFSRNFAVTKFLEAMQAEFLDSIPHQQCTLDKIERTLNREQYNGWLSNTCINIQRESTITLEPVYKYDEGERIADD